MAKGYWILHVTVNDSARYAEYIAADAKVFEKFTMRPLVRAGRYELPEGGVHSRHVVFEFDSYEQAVACYHSPEYQAAVRLRRAASESEIVIVEGVA